MLMSKMVLIIWLFLRAILEIKQLRNWKKMNVLGSMVMVYLEFNGCDRVTESGQHAYQQFNVIFSICVHSEPVSVPFLENYTSQIRQMIVGLCHIAKICEIECIFFIVIKTIAYRFLSSSSQSNIESNYKKKLTIQREMLENFQNIVWIEVQDGFAHLRLHCNFTLAHNRFWAWQTEFDIVI